MIDYNDDMENNQTNYVFLTLDEFQDIGDFNIIDEYCNYFMDTLKDKVYEVFEENDDSIVYLLISNKTSGINASLATAFHEGYGGSVRLLYVSGDIFDTYHGYQFVDQKEMLDYFKERKI